MNKDIQVLLRSLKNAGWIIERTTRNHYKVTKGAEVVVLAGTPSDPRSLRNMRAELRRRGAQI